MWPRAVSYIVLTLKQVVGAATGDENTAVWTEAGELFTFGRLWRLGHGGAYQGVPVLVEALY